MPPRGAVSGKESSQETGGGERQDKKGKEKDRSYTVIPPAKLRLLKVLSAMTLSSSQLL